jgi:hypothetical protein
MRTWPTPATLWMRLMMIWSVIVDRSRRLWPVAVTVSCATEVLSSPWRMMNGSLASRGNDGRTSATLSRSSIIALSILVDSANSTETPARPSHELLRMLFTPLTVLTAFSIGRVMSISTADGEAPGYCTSIHAYGISTLGIDSSGSARYEKMPSTTSATMTMVAKTGFWMLVRVIHMASAFLRRCGDGGGGRRGCGQLHFGAGFDPFQFRHDDVGALVQARQHFDVALVLVAHAQLDRLRDHLAVVDPVDQRLVLDAAPTAAPAGSPRSAR